MIHWLRELHQNTHAQTAVNLCPSQSPAFKCAAIWFMRLNLIECKCFVLLRKLWTCEFLKYVFYRVQAADGFLFVVQCDTGRIIYVSDSITPVLNQSQVKWSFSASVLSFQFTACMMLWSFIAFLFGIIYRIFSPCGFCILTFLIFFFISF